MNINEKIFVGLFILIILVYLVIELFNYCYPHYYECPDCQPDYKCGYVSKILFDRNAQ
jgi:hypothetical protein